MDIFCHYLSVHLVGSPREERKVEVEGEGEGKSIPSRMAWLIVEITHRVKICFRFNLNLLKVPQ